MEGLSPPPPQNFDFSGKTLINKEKFRVFLENLGIRGKICNILFKKCMLGKFFLLYVRKNVFIPFLYMSGKNFRREEILMGREEILGGRKF